MHGVVSILAILAGGIFICAICFQKAKEAENSADTTRLKAMQAIGITCAVCTFLYFCVIVFMRDRITLAIEITKESSKAFQDLPLMIFFPVFPFVCICVYLIWWIFTAVLIYSVQIETITPNPNWSKWFGSLYTGPPGWPNYNIYATNSTTVIGTGFKSYEWDTSMQTSFVVVFFHLLWNVEFFRFLTFLVFFNIFCIFYCRL